MDDEITREYRQFESLIQDLIDNQFASCDDFLDVNALAGLRLNIANLAAAGDLKTAGIGNLNDFHKNELIRGDQVHWIDNLSADAFEMIYLQKIWRFINHLNKTCFTSLNSFESHYASYGQGSFYKRHIDQFKSEKGRQYSIVLYLNENWTDLDEGLLSLYPLNLAQKNIAPISGRLVFFKSDEMEHEVHPSNTRERLSIAGWLKN